MNLTYPGGWTQQQLADTCYRDENNKYAVLAGLKNDAQSDNIATYNKATGPGSKALLIVNSGVKLVVAAKFLFTATIYVENNLTAVDVYRRI